MAGSLADCARLRWRGKGSSREDRRLHEDAVIDHVRRADADARTDAVTVVDEHEDRAQGNGTRAWRGDGRPAQSPRRMGLSVEALELRTGQRGRPLRGHPAHLRRQKWERTG